MLKDVIGEHMGDNKGDIGAGRKLGVGGVVGAVAQSAIYPMDLVKTRLQTCASEGGKAPHLGKLARDIWVQEGPRAFNKGLVPFILGIIPFASIDLTVYETLTDFSRTHILQDSGTFSVHFQYFGLAYFSVSSHFSCYCRTRSSSEYMLRSNLRSFRSNMHLPFAGYSNKV